MGFAFLLLGSILATIIFGCLLIATIDKGDE